MRTILAGLEVVRRSPLAFLPLTAEGAVAGLLVAVGAFPAGAASAPAAAVFPLGTYFDLKQALASGSGWSFVVAALAVGLLVRSASLAASLWLADGARGSFVVPWVRTLRLAVIAPAALLPAAVLHYSGYAARYAPFVAAGALVGVPAALVLVRRALMLDAGVAVPRGKTPGLGAFLAYGYLIALTGAAISILGRTGSLPAGIFVALLGPLHALVLLGWRARAKEAEPPHGAWIAIATGLAALLFLGAAVFDRTIRSPSNPGGLRGRLVLLGGVDSTSRSGALSKFQGRALGFPPRRTMLLSYRGIDGPYRASDTRGDLLETARKVGAQIDPVRHPRFLLGHSQASLILDRLIVEGLPLPDRAVILAGPPPFPPPVSVPAPGIEGPGRPAAEAARALSALLELARLPSFDIDAPASPPHLRPIVAPQSPVPRLAIWALGDSVWLDSDWRRPGEVNLVALSDHVGVTANAYAFDVARSFLRGRPVQGHEVSWQGFLVSTFRYAFEPWRP